VLAEYCFLLDSYRLKEFGPLFLESGEWISRNGSATGPAGIEQFTQTAASRRHCGTSQCDSNFRLNFARRLNSLRNKDKGERGRLRVRGR
jgi:hypothetical protein